MPEQQNPQKDPQKKPQNSKRSAIVSIILTVFILGALAFMLMGRSIGGGTQTDALETSQFTAAVNQGRVTEVTYNPSQYAVSGKYYPAITAGSQAAAAFNTAFSALNTELTNSYNAPGSLKTTTLDPSFLGSERSFTATSGGTSIETLMQRHPEIAYNVQVESSMWNVLASVLPMLLLCGLMVFFFWQMGKANNSQMSFGKARAKKTSEERPDVHFSDVAGCDEAVEEMKEVRDFLANPAKYQAIGAKVPHGCLLVALRAPANAARQGCCRRGQCAVLQHLGLRLRGDVRGRGRLPCARPVPAGEGSRPSIIFIDEMTRWAASARTGLGGGHDEASRP